jgi:hypothetical protein
MSHGLQPHLLRGRGGERRAPSAGAEEHEALVLGEDRLVVGALGIDPEFEHAARAMDRAGHLSLALQFARIADVHEHHVVAALQRHGIGGREGFDLRVGVIEKGLVAAGDGLGHGCDLPL